MFRRFSIMMPLIIVSLLWPVYTSRADSQLGNAQRMDELNVPHFSYYRLVMATNRFHQNLFVFRNSIRPHRVFIDIDVRVNFLLRRTNNFYRMAYYRAPYYMLQPMFRGLQYDYAMLRQSYYGVPSRSSYPGVQQYWNTCEYSWDELSNEFSAGYP